MGEREDQIRAIATAAFERERLGTIVAAGPPLVFVWAGLWGVVNGIVGESWAIAMILVGGLTGASVRAIGRGTRPIFYVIAVVLYFMCVTTAQALFGVVVGAGAIGRFTFVIHAMALAACVSFVGLGRTQEERWAMRDNRGLLDPAKPAGGAMGVVIAIVGLPLVWFVTLFFCVNVLGLGLED